MPTRRLNARPSWALTVGLVALVGLCWILLTPPGAGADEPSHLVRSGALVHGQLHGVETGHESNELFRLPDSYVLPEPGFWVYDPELGDVSSRIPVSAAPPVERTGATVELQTRADEYPLWGHLLLGLPTLLPGMAAVWWARLAAGLIGFGLVAWSLVRARTPLAAAGVLAAVTPMAWATAATVNPSALAVGGGVAVWAAAIPGARRERADAWLFALGWAALALPRRDGLIWACLIVALAVCGAGRNLLEFGRGLGRWPLALVGVSSALVVGWGVTNSSPVSRLVALAPLVLVAAEGARRVWVAAGERRGAAGRALVAVAGVLALSVGSAVVAVRRRGGWDAELTRAIVGETGRHLVEAVGVLGWLDTPLPWLVTVGWVVVIGLLTTAAAGGALRALALAATALAAAVLTSWLFELAQGATYGRYWQGRYSLPLLAGVPIALASVRPSEAAARRLAWAAGGGALVLVNVAAWSAARRWGVGTQGSYWPWDWNTPITPLPTLVVLLVHAAATATLAWTLFPRRDHT